MGLMCAFGVAWVFVLSAALPVANAWQGVGLAARGWMYGSHIAASAPLELCVAGMRRGVLQTGPDVRHGAD